MGETTAERLTVPENPPEPVTVMVINPEDLLLIDNVDELEATVKPGLVVEAAKDAPWTVSGSTPDGIAGLVTTTHVFVPVTLLGLQLDAVEVGNEMGVPLEVPTILYVMLNSSPVVGFGVEKPKATSASLAIPVVVFVEFASVTVICPENTLPAVLMPRGLMTVGSA